jgi:tRNA dimethylallyltransferase
MKSTDKPYLIVLIGPTAVGKTAVAISLAKWLNTEIVSADSRQFYREMDIGTAKPTKKEQNTVPHHLVDFLSIRQPYDVKTFEKDALLELGEIFARKPFAIATGGSGLYIKTLCEGIDDIPEVNEEVRKRLQERLENEGLEKLVGELKQKDPVYCGQADLQNPRRVLRAMEIIAITGEPYSHFRKQQHTAKRPFNILKIGLYRERERLYERINQRVDQMIAQGLVEEARRLYPFRNHNALQTVGYQEVFPYLEGAYDLEEAIRLIKRNTRRFAKRQLTWFRRDDEIRWFDADQKPSELLDSICTYLARELQL